ncbi:hypothetical protein ARALYDRAFT_350435 [Arabidopsis lyrata subsp. lyrata]|uniref:Leucine aminopeptidase n=1 Tax=Arabidopsis lyrata subsp. lyrata TaxID=81972 RepID=D7M525_ARALL|nr:hypothetical protein ARALYDRAFT_350435 [Arabidopsis lyrata subsp. lyrata]
MKALCDGCEQFMCFPPGHIYSSKQVDTLTDIKVVKLVLVMDFHLFSGLRRLYNPPWFSELVPSTPYDPLAVRNTFEKQGEELFGDYEWERFDLLVLPPSFPYGGMENPRMVFLTPTVIRGDATGAQVVAHELAHSWTGNLITNINNEHFWLNEGFTTYAERRIVEVVQGADRATLNIGIGWRGLTDEMERFKDNLECTKLWNKQEGVDPDDVYSQVPYEKGFQFVLRIERQIGRTAFDEFLKIYIATFKFKSIDANTFLEFLKANIPGIEKEINLQLWTEGVGIPEDAYELASTIYTKIISLAKEFKEGRMPGEDDGAEWNGQEWELYLENLTKSCEPSQVMALDKRYRLAESKDYEVKVSFLQLAVASKCREYHGEDKTEDSRPEKLQKLAEKTPAIV